MSDALWNAIYIDGLLLEDISSGDVSFVAEKVGEAIASGGNWVTIPTGPGARYELYVASSSSVVVRYRDA